MLHVANSIRSADTDKTGKVTDKTVVADKLIKLSLRKRKFKKRLHEGDDHPPRIPLPIDESEYSLCVLLWQSTIIQALYDLASTGSSADSRLIKAEAAGWFFLPKSNDFTLVCELACLCPVKVKRMARKVAKEGEKALEGFNFRTIRKDLSDRAPTRRKPKAAKGGRP